MNITISFFFITLGANTFWHHFGRKRPWKDSILIGSLAAVIYLILMGAVKLIGIM